MSRTKRSAFTLIEILIVIAIIGILASLILGAVMMMRGNANNVMTRNDILQLGTAMDSFYSKYSFYPPNRLRLCSNRASYGAITTLDKQSVAAITKMFPNINWTGIAWDGTANTALDVTLEGDQCLVFFLGGIPNGAGKPPQGFSMNPANPALLTGDRLKFMTFDGARIQLLHANNFPSFLDGYAVNLIAGKKQPYLYFSSMSLVNRENGYDPTASGPAGVVVSPYVQQSGPPVKYWNSNRYQIVSAGADGLFGPGGLWPSNPLSGVVIDDMSNFNSSRLGAPD